MDIFSVIIQGVIQGLTEFLPVSSSGHLALFNYFANGGQAAEGSITALLHFGTLVAVFIAFRKRIAALAVEFVHMIKDIFRGKFTFKNMNVNRRMICMLIVALLPLFLVLPLKDTIEGFGSDDNLWVEGVCFLVTGVLLMLSHRIVQKKKGGREVSLKSALTVGVTQAFSTLPGLSRSGSTIAAGMCTGLDKQTAFEFSFILGIPAVLGAFLLDVKDIAEAGVSPAPILYIVIGVIVAAVVGYFSIVMLNILLKKDKFVLFGYYTLIIGAFALIASIYQAATGSIIFLF